MTWRDQRIAFTIFPDTSAKTKRDERGTWGAFIETLRTLPVKATKAACHMVNGATFGEIRTENNCLRSQGNIGQVSFVEGDYDDGLVTPGEAAQRLRDAGIEAVICTTASHRPEAPRWRVFALLSEPCEPAERRRHVAVLNGALGGILNAESFALSLSFYIGPVRGVPYEVLHVDGAPVDLDLFASEVYPKGAQTAMPLGRHVPPDNDVARALRSAGMVRGANRDGSLIIDCPRQEHHTSGKTEGTATVYFLPNTGGFPHGAFKCMHGHCQVPQGEFKKALGMEVLDDGAAVLQQLREMDAEQLKAEWADLAATLTPEAADEAKNWVHRETGIGKRPLDASLKAARDRLARTRRTVAAQSGGRVEMLYRPDNSVQQSQDIMRLILAAHPVGECLMFADLLSMLTERPLPYAHGIGSDDEPPPASILIQAHTDVTVRALIEKTVVMQVEQKAGPVSVAVPPLITSAALEVPPAETPRCSGHIAHPIVLQDGTVLAANGLDSRTGLYLHSIDGKPPRPFTRAEAATALQRLEEFFEGFPFASKRDRHVAVAALFTAIVRRILDAAPALVIVAPVQSSGKTTLARFIHLVLTGRDMPVVTLTLGRDDETEKRLVAMLMHSPPMITFDNVTEGMTLRCGPAFNAVLTAAEYESRLLGLTRKVVVPTNTFVCVTGNNLRFGADEVSRMLTVSLAPQEARPEQRRYPVKNIVAHVRTKRSSVLRDALGIVAGYLGSSGEKVELPTGSRFGQWDRMVREPMVWAGATDPAECFAANAADSDHEVALRVLLQVLQQEFGDETFTARDVLGIQWSSKSGDDSAGHAVADSLEALRARDVTSAKSIGRVLTAYVGRTVEIRPGFSLRLQARSAPGRPQLYCVTQGVPLV